MGHCLFQHWYNFYYFFLYFNSVAARALSGIKKIFLNHKETIFMFQRLIYIEINFEVTGVHFAVFYQLEQSLP